MLKTIFYLNLFLTSSLFADESMRLSVREMVDNYFNNTDRCEFSNSFYCHQPKYYDFQSALEHTLSSSQLNEYLVKDEKSVFIPLELNNHELLMLAASTSLGVVAFNNDQEISDLIKRNNTVVANTISAVGNFYGSFAFGTIAAGSYFLGVHYDNDGLKKVGIFIVSAEVAQSIITEAVKLTFKRERPDMGDGPYHFYQPGNNSFWSGHTATAFTLATVISEMYKDDYPVVPYVAYGLATLTAYGRVHDNRHWASDVIMGGIAGHLIAKLSLSALNNDGKRGGLTVYPSVDYETGTVMANFKWTPKEKLAPFKCEKLPEGELKISACIKEAFERSKK